MMFNRETVNPHISDQCDSCKKLRIHAETAYSRGYKSGSLNNENFVVQARTALEEEHEGRLQDNHVFTTEISRLEEIIRELESRAEDRRFT